MTAPMPVAIAIWSQWLWSQRMPDWMKLPAFSPTSAGSIAGGFAAALLFWDVKLP